MRSIVSRGVHAFFKRTGRFGHVYKLIGAPCGWDWADFLRRQGHIIGEGTTVNPGAQLMDPGLVRIGRHCSISYANFVTHSGGDRIIRERWGQAVNSSRPIVVGDNCIVGCNVTIMYGVTIGDNSVIGAGCYVSRDVPAGTVMKPPESMPACSTEDYVRRLAARTGRREPTEPAAASAPRALAIPGWLWRLGLAFGMGALFVPSPFFD